MMTKRIAATLAGAALVAVPVLAAPAPFHFRSLEFLSSDQRLPSAQQFVAYAAHPGTPMAVAQGRMTNAGARCRASADGSGVMCEYTMAEHNTGYPMRDIAWRVRLLPDGHGRVMASSVDRKIYGV